MFGTPPIRPLSFSDILDNMAGEDQLGDDEDWRPNREIRPDMGWFFHLLSLAAAPEGQAEEIRAQRSDPYGENRIDLPLLAAADDDDSIAAELALSRVKNLAELKQIRRAFALRNHPDLFQPNMRPRATRRMKVANMLIDRRSRELAAGL
jgi:hypothetical protein